jgi:inner membrane protease subunit 1
MAPLSTLLRPFVRRAQASQQPSLLGHPFRLLFRTVKYFCFAHLFWEYGYSIGPAEGPSMLPTFEVSNEWILISKLYRYGRGIQVGDLVNYKIPIEPHAEGIKRVVGLPGDYVLIDSPDSGSDAMIQVGHAHYTCMLSGMVRC